MTRRSIAFLVVAAVLALPSSALAGELVFADRDARTTSVAPSSDQRAAAEQLDAEVSWTRFGTPASLFQHDGALAENLQGGSAAKVARNFAEQQTELLGLSEASLDRLQVTADSRLVGGSAHAVVLRQTFGGLPAAEGGLLVVAVQGDDVVYASGSLTRDARLAAQPVLSAAEGWARAGGDVGLGGSIVNVLATRKGAGWTLLAVGGLPDPQRARLVAVPTPSRGVRPAWETLVLDQRGTVPRAFTHFVDAATGEILIRRDLVEQSHPSAATFTGAVPPTDGACAADNGPWTVASGESIGSVAVAVEATLTTNDSVIQLVRDGVVVATQDTGASPEALAYNPADSGAGTYFVRVCDFSDGAGWDAPTTYTGEIAFTPATVDGDFPYPPKWTVFPSTPLIGGDAFPWSYPSTDNRETWCWDSTVGNPPTNLAECDREVQNSASRAPWDYSYRAGAPTFTPVGNNAQASEGWTNFRAPGPTAYRPVSLRRDYSYPWTNAWHKSDCFTPFVPGQSHDIDAAATNLFAMHNRMHDWSYHLGFDEAHWNAQESNLGNGGPGTLENDPVLGNAQAGALAGGFPAYNGRDNANMTSLPDGTPPITNMYLWQPIAATFYAPCVDGDFDMSVIGHEYGHLIENRMIGKGGNRAGHHAGAMGESSGDLLAVEYLNEYGFVPVSGENPFAVGGYVTGDAQRGIRNYGMNFPRTGPFPAPGSLPRTDPLNFSNMGYDLTGPQVHADGEIWSATNYDIRQALVQKYGGSDRATQIACAEGKRPVDQCPGNRRWIQIMFDAYLLMPTAPSMLQARDAYLAADRMRFGGANQAELWNAFAQRGFGEAAFSSNTLADTDTDPKPDFASPLHDEATVTFTAVDAVTGAPVPARVFVGTFEARTSPVADTDPATSAPAPGVDNLDATAALVAGTYDFVGRAAGYGHFRFTQTLAAGERKSVKLSLSPNVASAASGAAASGDGVRHGELIDDTEATNWERTGTVPSVSGSTVVVDLAGSSQVFDRAQVSAMLTPGQNRFTAVRQFELLACGATVANANCANPAIGYTRFFTSPVDAFPGTTPRPIAPELILRTFTVPRTTATHVAIRVLTNQCTGTAAFQGEQDADPTNGTDCREGSPGATVELIGDLPQVVAPRDNEVRIAELQLFNGPSSVAGARGGKK